MQILILRKTKAKRFISREQGNRYPREGLMYALIIIPLYERDCSRRLMRTKLHVLYVVVFAETENIL